MPDLTTEARAGVWNVLTDLIADYPMWIGDDGKPLDYSPQRETAISDFIAEATEGIEPVIARVIADARAEAVTAMEDWAKRHPRAKLSDDEVGDFARTLDAITATNPTPANPQRDTAREGEGE